MPVTLKIFAEGQLPNSKTTLYTSTARTLYKIVMVNTDSVSRTIDIYSKPGSTSRRIEAAAKTLTSGEKLAIGPHILESGDLIEGNASAAAVIDYIIEGFEIT